MKSGNVIHVDHVKDWNLKYTGNEITNLKIVREKLLFRSVKGLIVPSLDLSQIEAIVET